MSARPREKGATVAVRVRIAGRVQNVWFRAWATEQAVARGLRGWVRNRRDGTVEAHLVGPAEDVTAMIEACRAGPPLAEVRQLSSEPAEDDGSGGFRPLPTA